MFPNEDKSETATWEPEAGKKKNHLNPGVYFKKKKKRQASKQ